MTTPSFHQDTELSVNVSPPLAGFDDGFRATFTQEINDYQHEIRADGGYWSCDLALTGSQAALEDWLWRGLGRHVVVSDPGLNTIWEGFVNEVTLNLGPLSITRGPLTEVANRVYVSYAVTTVTINPPATGTKTVTTAANDTDSQAQYGIIEWVENGGQIPATEAAQTAAVCLASRKDPKNTHRYGSAGGQGVNLKCAGYAQLLDRYYYQQTASSGTLNLSDKIAAILDADPNAFFSSTNANLTANTFQVAAYDKASATAWSVLGGLTKLGDAAYGRMLLGVYRNRLVSYVPIPTDVAYTYRLSDPAQRIERGPGQAVSPWNILPGRWAFCADILVGRAPLTAPSPADPRYTFLNSVTWKAGQVIPTWQGGTVDKISQRLARMGLRSTP
jgi:hypothetical protein